MTTSTKATKAILSDIEKEALNNIIPSLKIDNDIVSEYVSNKQAKKEIVAKMKSDLPKVISEITIAISDLKAKGYKTKTAYKEALDAYKAKKGANGELNAEIGIVTYMLNLGVSLNKIESNVSELYKWRRNKLSLSDIIKIAK